MTTLSGEAACSNTATVTDVSLRGESVLMAHPVVCEGLPQPSSPQHHLHHHQPSQFVPCSAVFASCMRDLLCLSFDTADAVVVTTGPQTTGGFDPALHSTLRSGEQALPGSRAPRHVQLKPPRGAREGNSTGMETKMWRNPKERQHWEQQTRSRTQPAIKGPISRERKPVPSSSHRNRTTYATEEWSSVSEPQCTQSCGCLG
jgi:hypothetical protein